MLYDNLDNNSTENYGVVGSFGQDRDVDFKAATKHLFESMKSVYQMDAISEAAKIFNMEQTKDSYKELLLEDVTVPTDDPYYAMLPAKIEQLIENTGLEMLKESSVAALQPIVGITLPVLKKTFIEGHAKDIVMTEVPAKPIIKMAFERRFLKDASGTKHYIPDIFYDDSYKTIINQGKGNEISNKFYPLDIPDTGSGAQVVNLPIQDFDILTASGGSIQNRNSLDKDFCVQAVTFDVDGTIYTVNNLNIQPDMAADSTFQCRIKAPKANSAGVILEDILFGKVDFYWGKVSVASSAGYIKKVQFGGHLSNENNTNTIEIDRERETMSWTIGDGVHLNTGITIERLRDYKALFDYDLSAEIVSDMSTTLSQMEDSDTLGYVSGRFDMWKQNDKALERFGYTDGFVREGWFSCEPGVNKYVTRSQYIESELKYDLNRFIDELKILLKVPDLMFVVYGHPNVVTLIQDNVRWVIDEDTKIGGIQLDYRFGVMTANKNRIHVLSTLKCPKERGLRVVAYPLSKDIVTFKHYKYSLNIENGYRNSLTPLTPNIMATSRYLTTDVLPVQGEFHIIDNQFGLVNPNASVATQTAQPIVGNGTTTLSVSSADFPAGYPLYVYSKDPSALMYYTVDGNDPTDASTPVPPTGIITVTSTATVKVVAVKPGEAMSEASTVDVTFS